MDPFLSSILRNESIDAQEGETQWERILCDTRKSSCFFCPAEQGRSTVPCPSRRATPPSIVQAERSTTCNDTTARCVAPRAGQVHGMDRNDRACERRAGDLVENKESNEMPLEILAVRPWNP